MFHPARFALTSKALLAVAVAAVYPVAAYPAVAGKIDFAVGGVTVTSPDGRSRPLQKGVEIESGDLIQTGTGRAQVRFTDGGLISLQPNTEFRIDDYSYNGKTDGSEKGFFSLVKGGFRAITGAIGHVNKKNYAVNTPVATIGIRGTEFLAQLNEALYMTCGEGICVLSNKGGELVLYAGESGKATDESVAPSSSDEKPNLRPSQKGDDRPGFLYSSSEDRDVNGNPCSITGCASGGQILPSGPGYAAAFVDSGTSGASWGGIAGGVDGGDGFTANFNGSGHLTHLSGGTTPNGNPNFELGSNAVAISSGSDGIIAWGRWLGNVVDGGEGATTFGPKDGWHYVVGIPTARMPQSGTATYSLIGATIPSSPTLGNGTFTGSLAVDFSTNDVITNFAVTFASGTATFVDQIASANGLHSFGGTVSGTGSLCAGNCSAGLQGFFAGAQAARAGMAYQISNLIAGGNINGTAAFTQTVTKQLGYNGCGFGCD